MIYNKSNQKFIDNFLYELKSVEELILGEKEVWYNPQDYSVYYKDSEGIKKWQDFLPEVMECKNKAVFYDGSKEPKLTVFEEHYKDLEVFNKKLALLKENEDTSNVFDYEFSKDDYDAILEHLAVGGKEIKVRISKKAYCLELVKVCIFDDKIRCKVQIIDSYEFSL